MTIFGFAKYLASRLIQQPSMTGGPKPYAPNAGNVFFALFAAVGMVGAVGYGFNTVLRGPIAAMTDTTKRTVAESTVITSSRLAIVGATTQQTGAGDTDNDGYIEPVPYRDAGAAPHPAGGGYLPAALNIPSTIDPWNTEYGYCAWDHGSITASSRRLAGSPNNNRYAIAIISAGKDKRFQTSCVAYVDDTTTLIQMTPGSDDIVLAYTYAEANNLGNGLWKPHASAPNTAVTDRNIDVTGGGIVSGGVVLSGNTATGGGLILPSDPGDDSISGACNGANDNQLRYNVSVPTEAPVIEICDNGGLGWSPISGGASGGGGVTTGQLVLHYKLDENSGTTASDEGGINNGTLANGPTWRPGQGRVDGALSFDGNNDRITVANHASLRPTAFTIAAWINLPAAQSNGNAKILTKEWQGHSGPVYTSFSWSLSSASDLVFETGHTDMNVHLYVGATITPNQWTHVVTLFDPAQTPPKRVYVNGVLVDSDSDATPLLYDTATNGDGDLIIGQSSGGSESAAVTLDDLRIYNYGMTDEEVMELYASVNPSSLNLDAPKKAGTIFSWGTDSNGKLGNGTAETANKQSPGPIDSTNSDFIDVSTGELHTCGVKLDGSVWCWGYDLQGQLGNGAGGADQPSPIAVSNLSNIVKVSSGQRHTCALRNDGNVFCWGQGAGGKLGDGAIVNRDSPVQVMGISNVIDISAGRSITCAVVDDGRAWCWGDGYLGNGTVSTSLIPVEVSTITDFVQISQSGVNWDGAICGLTRQGKIYCWGDDMNQSLGNGASSAPQTSPGEVSGTINDFSKVSSNNNTVCAIAGQNGGVACWGKGSQGEIGNGSAAHSSIPTYVPGLSGIVDIAVGSNSVCAVERTGKVWCWGADTNGQLGNGEAISTQQNSPVLTKITNAYKISGSGASFSALVDTNTYVSAAPPQYAKKFSSASGETNALHSCHIRSDGTMWCWGVEHAGELGNGGGLTDTAASPVRVTDPGPWVSVTTGTDTTCGIKVDGSAWCWGDDGSGQLGNGATAGSQATPVIVSVATSASWAQLNAGHNSTCGIKADGTAFCWGDDSAGKLGNGAGGTTNEPGGTPITSSLPWIQISQGGDTTCGIKSDNTLWCWGEGSEGQLGNGTTGPALQTPAQVGTDKWRYVDATGPCAIKTDGSLWCWGWNINARLGIGTTYTGDQSVPRLVVEPGPWASVKAGSFDVTCGVKVDGTGWCWGDNGGALGIGSTPGADVPYPMPVVGKDWVHIDNGGTILRCGIKNDDSIWCWGNDFLDVLGNGTGNSSSNYPQRIYQPYKSAFAATDATTSTYAAIPAANLAIGTTPLTNVEDVVEGLSFPGAGRTLLTKATAANQFQLLSNQGGGASQIWLNANGYPYYMGYSGYTGGLEFGYGADWLTNYTKSSLEVAAEGFVGLGTGGAPVAKLDVRGAIRPGDAGVTCGAGQGGVIKYASSALTYCNGTSWVPFGASSILKLWDGLSVRTNTACGVKVDGTLWCWGDQQYGKLGNGVTTGNQTTPMQIGTAKWSGVYTSSDHTCGIQSNGTLWCWGERAYGKLGNGSTGGSQSTPLQIGTATWNDLYAAGRHTCGIQTNGTLWCWGDQANGKLGNGVTSGNQTTPLQIGTATWLQITNALDDTCGIQTNGTLWCWGDQGSGKLGNGVTSGAQTTPLQIGTATWSVISAAIDHTCGIQTDGTLWCWGSRLLGKVGSGSTSGNQTTPIQIGTATWKTVSTAPGHTCGIQTNGALWCWGEQANGKLGNGITSGSQSTPLQIGADTWLSVAAASNSTCARRSNGTGWCWGYASSGVLGNGTTAPDVTSPGAIYP